jgi:AGCS family alanine or glycine:cation symporter
VGLMAWLNIIAILILQKPALVALRDYEAQKRAGLDPTFNPAALGIRNATLWENLPKPLQDTQLPAEPAIVKPSGSG